MTISYIIYIVITIVFAMFLGTINALLSHFLDYCFWEGSIFSSWLPKLAKWNLRQFRPELLKSLESAKKNPEYDNMCIDFAKNMFFFKILGGCAICSNIWIGFFTFSGINLALGLNWFLIFPYLLFSSFVLRKIFN